MLGIQQRTREANPLLLCSGMLQPWAFGASVTSRSLVLYRFQKKGIGLGLKKGVLCLLEPLLKPLEIVPLFVFPRKKT